MSDLDKEYEASLKSIETENKIDRIFYRPIGFRIARMLKGTGITPNMVTSMNLLLVLPLVCVTAWYHKFIILSLLIQVYVFLDIMDGSLARNKNMKSEFGRKLDILSDTFFYTVGYFFIGIGMDEPIWT